MSGAVEIIVQYFSQSPLAQNHIGNHCQDKDKLTERPEAQNCALKAYNRQYHTLLPSAMALLGERQRWWTFPWGALLRSNIEQLLFCTDDGPEMQVENEYDLNMTGQYAQEGKNRCQITYYQYEINWAYYVFISVWFNFGEEKMNLPAVWTSTREHMAQCRTDGEGEKWGSF